MSFASHTKKELTSLDVSDCCAKSELSALIRMNGVVSLANRKFVVDVKTENAAIARRIYALIKQLYDLHVDWLVRRKMKLKKNNVYIARITEEASVILEDLKIMVGPFNFVHEVEPALIVNDCCKRAYLRGAFLAGGSINNPETSAYHLEIISIYEEHANSINSLMNSFELNSKVLERKKGFLCYIKESEKISDFLTVVGAHYALMHFEDARIMRDMRNNVNRITNCDNANINKTVSAAGRQVDNINLIDEKVGLDSLSEKLREVAVARIKNHDAPLKELCEIIGISKSGLNHRLKKIDALAEQLRAGISIDEMK